MGFLLVVFILELKLQIHSYFTTRKSKNKAESLNPAPAVCFLIRSDRKFTLSSPKYNRQHKLLLRAAGHRVYGNPSLECLCFH